MRKSVQNIKVIVLQALSNIVNRAHTRHPTHTHAHCNTRENTVLINTYMYRPSVLRKSFTMVIATQ